MSTDLEFCQDLPKIILSPIKIMHTQQQCSSITTADGGIGSIVQEKGSNEDSSELCKTPKSEENKIPAVFCCPPAPRKPKIRTVSCKRKLANEMQFFEIPNREEVDSFFRSSFELEGIRSFVKRKNYCTSGSCK